MGGICSVKKMNATDSDLHAGGGMERETIEKLAILRSI